LVPVINKIDLPSADPDRVLAEIEEELSIDSSDAILCSAKTGQGVAEILEAIIRIVPAPKDRANEPLQGLIFDSWFDSYLGAVSLIRVMAGNIKKGDKMLMMSTHKKFEVLKIAQLTPKPVDVDELSVGQVGIVAGSVKTISDTRVGDTITNADNPATSAVAGFKKAKQMVFGGIFHIDSSHAQRQP
jgi:GTP-binding protein LepA